MAPEAMTSPDSLGPQSDLYGLGAVAYYLLTGSPPFTGQSIVEICAHHLHSTPKPISERSPKPVPEALERVVMACLAKRPEERPESADELARWLAACAVPAWTNESARAWWDAHAELVQKRRAEASQSLRPQELDRATVAVELPSRNSAEK
jgi:serine/threonine-protein kinase